MNRTSTLLLTALLLAPACDSGDAPAAADEAKPAAAEAKAEKPAEVAAAADADAEEPAEAEAKAVASGLALGDKFVAFDILNCDSGEQYCQVCRFGGSPKIMAVGTIDDPDFRKDLQDLDAIAKKYADKDVKAFAVIADAQDGKLATPLASAAELQEKAKALRTELNISIPVVIPAAEGDKPNARWEEHYQVSESRTIMFADGRNQVQYSQVAPSDYAELDKAIQAVVGS